MGTWGGAAGYGDLGAASTAGNGEGCDAANWQAAQSACIEASRAHRAAVADLFRSLGG